MFGNSVGSKKHQTDSKKLVHIYTRLFVDSVDTLANSAAIINLLVVGLHRLGYKIRQSAHCTIHAVLKVMVAIALNSTSGLHDYTLIKPRISTTASSAKMPDRYNSAARISSSVLGFSSDMANLNVEVMLIRNQSCAAIGEINNVVIDPFSLEPVTFDVDMKAHLLRIALNLRDRVVIFHDFSLITYEP